MKDILQRAIDLAKARGAQAAECHYSQGHSAQVRVRGGEIEDIETSFSSGLSIHVIKDGREGYSYTQDMDKLAEMADMAVAHAELVEPDSVEPEIYAGDAAYARLNTYNPALEAMTQAQRNDMAIELERTVFRLDDRVKETEYCVVGSRSGEGAFLNSAGIFASEKRNSLLAYVYPIIRGEGDAQSGMGFKVARSLEDISLEAIARQAIDETAALLGAKSMKTGSYPALLRADVACELLSAFTGIYSAEQAQKGRSLLAGREGDEIASALFTLVDEPHNEKIFSCTAADAQGLPTRRIAIVEKGRFHTLMHNLTTARKANTASTAHASTGGLGSPVRVAPHALVLQPGTSSEEALFKRMGNGLFVTSIGGLHAGLNPVSGDFSLLAGGFVIENGEKARAVNQLTVAGNIFEVMRDIVELGDTPLYNHYAGDVAAPMVLLEKISVAGE